MAISSNSKLESFIKMMNEGEEYARHGFDLLSKRDKPEEYFNALAQSGFFEPSRNPAPTPSTEPGFVQIPFWTALTYLEAVAKRSGELNDLPIANKVMDVIRKVSTFREPSGEIRENSTTYWKFAEILALVPTSAITLSDIDLVRGWINSKFDRGLIGRILGTKVIGRLLTGDENDIEKACVLLEQCTQFVWLDEKRRGRDVATLIDDYWLKELISRNATIFGVKAGQRAADIFANRLRELFIEEHRPFGSSLWRPAVEDNPQNYDFRSADNRFVEGLRDVLLGWIDTNGDAARTYVGKGLDDPFEIIRRIAIHCVTERFDVLQSAFEASISSALFVAGLRHEVYRLLRERFSVFSQPAKAEIVKAIKSIPAPTTGEDQEVRRKRTQRDWLTAIKDQAYQPALDLYNSLASEPSIGSPSDHPDFLSYHESRWGPGPSPFGVDALLAFAKDGTIIQRLNEFKEGDPWKGPTLEGLIDALQNAVGEYPDQFIPLIGSFHAAKLTFQYALLNGFKTILGSQKDETKKIDWNILWPKLLTYFSECTDDPTFWEESPVEDGRRVANLNWMVTLFADFLESGTSNDETAYAPELLPIGWEILQSILTKIPPSADEAEISNPMNYALNTARGRTISALFNHALRVCRLAEKENKTHSAAWESLHNVFDAELAKCQNSNFEFSTHSGAFLANIDFLSRDWLTANVGRLFPDNYPANFKCAVAGLAYATPTRPIYKTLARSNVLARALDISLEDSHGRERIIEWISLAYLWGDESIDSPLVSRLFQGSQTDDLETATWFFWTVRGEKLSAEQIEKIMDFWSRTILWARRQAIPPKKLYANLGNLICYIQSVDERGKELLLAVAPHVHSEFAADQMVEELARFVRLQSQCGRRRFGENARSKRAYR